MMMDDGGDRQTPTHPLQAAAARPISAMLAERQQTVETELDSVEEAYEACLHTSIKRWNEPGVHERVVAGDKALLEEMDGTIVTALRTMREDGGPLDREMVRY